MTQAQKTAKEKFKKAIEYRKKTGVSLKEAFAHVYGKKVGAVKKAPVKKASSGKHVDTKSHNVNIKIISGIGNITNSKYNVWGIQIGLKEVKANNEIYLQLMDLTNNKPIIKIIPSMTSKELDATAYDIKEYIVYYTKQKYTYSEAEKLKQKLKKLVVLIHKEVK